MLESNSGIPVKRDSVVMSTGTRFKLRVCTWNVGNAQPPVDLHEWLGTDTDEFDIIAVGAQEANFGNEKTQSPLSASSPVSNLELSPPAVAKVSSFSSSNLSLNTFSTSSTSGKLRKLSRAVRGVRPWRSAKKGKPTHGAEVDGEVSISYETHSPLQKYKTVNFSAAWNQNLLESYCDDVHRSLRKRTSAPLPFYAGAGEIETNSEKPLIAEQHFSSKDRCSVQDHDEFDIPVHAFEDLDDVRPRSIDGANASDGDSSSTAASLIEDQELTAFPHASPFIDPQSHEQQGSDCKDEEYSISRNHHPETMPPSEPKLHRMLTGNWVRRVQSTKNPLNSPWKLGDREADFDEPSKGTQASEGNRKKFSQVIESCMPAEYELVAKYHLMEIKLLIFVHDRLSSRVVKTERVAEATGIGNLVGNKGGVAVKLTIDDTTFCFICSHLAAHEGAKFLQQRNDDVIEIMRNIERNKIHGLPVMHQYNHIFWMGDLNYRLDLKRVIPAAVMWSHQKRWCHVTDMITDGHFEKLAEFDELIHEMERGRVFAGFKEGGITFAPTFKVERGKQYSAYQSTRVPSYCDRILYHSLPFHENHIKLLKYSSVPSIETSDHKPVYAIFDMIIPLPIQIYQLPPPRDALKCVLDFKYLRLHGLYEKRADIDDGSIHYEVLSDGALAVQETAPLQSARNSLLRLDTDTSPSHTRRVVHADFHGGGIFVKERPYRAEVPLRDGRVRACGYAELPKIPLRPVRRLSDLTYKHATVVFTRLGSKQGSSCVLPLCLFAEARGRHHINTVLDLTKYGSPIAQVELQVELVVSMEAWIDSKNNAVRMRR